MSRRIVPFMKRPGSLQAFYIILLLLLPAMTGCGGAERFKAPWVSSSSKETTGRLGRTDTDKTVIVLRGDTLYSLSRRHKIPVRVLITENDLKPPYALITGQKLHVPASRWYTVAPGETLSAIANRYHVGVDDVAQKNNLSPPYIIRAGQVLVLPPDVKSRKSTPIQVEKAAEHTPNSSPQPTKKAAIRPASAEKGMSPDTKASSHGKQAFVWPVQGRIVGSFGPAGKGFRNDGINIAAPAGTPVRAANKGTVAYAGNGIKGFGNLILVKHEGGWMTAYAHSSDILVRRGDIVQRGQAIARIGSTGNVKHPQLHFEIRRGSQALDPQVYLPKMVAVR
ncbi:peptidoglycan DD-metalloendopeptidase family protein [Haematospirillum sp. 15-248]|uniref:M23 family metallopeptidase n=1 Tax=Haematospirillum sp. 15-248 TaxID=2723107 RepID=UPI0014389C5F|nr:M23 family metallopeptidase [Haematospirillum sp. 15-248]NKD86969.1 peptidoglycan DD-metalloendopeptidase family protein [Haematospirillum sp. 15-248]